MLGLFTALLVISDNFQLHISVRIDILRLQKKAIMEVIETLLITKIFCLLVSQLTIMSET